MTDPAGSVDEAVAALRDLNLAAAAFRQALAAHYGVSVSETHAVSYLAAYGPLGQSQLAQRLALSTSAVTSLLDRLETAGVVQRRAHPSDRRRIEVSVTDQGMRAVTETRDRLRAVVTGIDAGDRAVASRVMRQISDGMRATAAQLPPARAAR